MISKPSAADFLRPVLRTGSIKNRILATILYLELVQKQDLVRSAEILSVMKGARVPRSSSTNVSGHLATMSGLVHSPGKDGAANLWQLTQEGRSAARTVLGLPEVDVSLHAEADMLRTTAKGIHDPDIIDFLDEAAACIEAGALRASVVFTWMGAIRIVQDWMIGQGAAQAGKALAKHDPNGRRISRIDDFSYYKESTQLLAAQDLGLVDKGQRQTLEQCLGERNKCGHPGKYKPGIKKVAATIEDLASIVFARA